MPTENRQRADKVFKTLGLVVASSAGNGRYLRSALKEGFRFWISSYLQQRYDKFGIQIMKKTAPLEISSAVSQQLIDKGFTRKDSGDKTEYFKIIDFLPDGEPDFRGIMLIYREALDIPELQKVL